MAQRSATCYARMTKEVAALIADAYLSTSPRVARPTREPIAHTASSIASAPQQLVGTRTHHHFPGRRCGVFVALQVADQPVQAREKRFDRVADQEGNR